MQKIKVLIAGLPGKMATMLAERLVDDEKYQLIPVSFTGFEIPENSIEIKKRTGQIVTIGLIRPDKREAVIHEIKSTHPNLVIIDFTEPNAVVENCEFYCNHNIPFIMGTTGGNRDLLPTIVMKSETAAVISPNMSPAIVLVMDMFGNAADKYPDALKGFDLEIIESHQPTKKDISGTAQAIGKKLKILGVNYLGEKMIIAVRDKIRQLFMGIPREFIDAHGWHSYRVLSPDRSVFLKFEHNVNGRKTYIDGTLVALDFLFKKINTGVSGKCFSMIDVLKG